MSGSDSYEAGKIVSDADSRVFPRHLTVTGKVYSQPAVLLGARLGYTVYKLNGWNMYGTLLKCSSTERY